MNVLVTGGAGYLGSMVAARLLHEGHNIRVLDSLLRGGTALLGLIPERRFELVRGDIRSSEVIAKALEGIEAVVHLAAIGGDPVCARDPSVCRSVNVTATRQLLEASYRAGVGRFVFASTCSNYGKVPSGEGLATEATALHPISLYARTKVQMEEAIAEAQAPSRCATTILRFATLFGVSPRMRFDLTVNEFTMRLLMDRELELYEEHSWRPYVHVVDAARAVAMVLAGPTASLTGQVFNVGDTTQNYQKRQIVDLIREHLDHEVRVHSVEGSADPRDYRVSFNKIARVLGFRGSRTVQDGIREVMGVLRNRVITDPRSNRYRN